MTDVSGVGGTLQRASTVLAATIILTTGSLSVAGPGPQPAQGRQQANSGSRANRDATALAEFQQRLKAYVQLRESLAKKLTPLSPTASASELAVRQDSLAAALKNVRKNARQGDLIPPRVAKQMARTIAADFKRRRPAATKAVLDEVPETVRPAVNNVFPDDAALATMPPLLLNNLPRLPDNLQYRFSGRDLVIVDGDTRLIIDHISDVLPAH